MQICGSVRGPASSSWLRLKSINGITLNGKDNIMLTHFHAVSFKSEKKNWLKIFSFFRSPSLVWDGGRKPPSQTVTQWSNESCLSIVMWHGYLNLVLVAHALLLFKKKKKQFCLRTSCSRYSKYLVIVLSCSLYCNVWSVDNKNQPQIIYYI